MPVLRDAIRLVGALVASACLAAVFAGCAAAEEKTAPDAGISLPAVDAGFDYQLGGGYQPPDGVSVVVRDRLEDPAGNGYDICYVNGFQTQPAESGDFARQHPDLVVHVDGAPLADPGWPDEFVLDTSSDAKRAAIAEIVGPWITGCRDAGYDAVEIDNLDSYTRSAGILSEDDNLALAAEYARIAHEADLAIAQKNTADAAAVLAGLGYDFAITESCREFDECETYTAVYPVVLDIEYSDELGEAGFGQACRTPVPGVVMILRDHDLLVPGDDGYLYRACDSDG